MAVATVRSASQVWTDYYAEYPIPSWVERRLVGTALRLVAEAGSLSRAPSVIEIGGAASHFAPHFLHAWPQTTSYTALDINEAGLATVPPGVTPLHCDILGDLPSLTASLVVSTGVIQAFDQVDVARAIGSHFALAEKGGLVLMTFPRDTWVYWIFRWIFTKLGLFPRDLYERPLTVREVATLVGDRGTVIGVKTVWSIGFTHTFLLLKAR